MTTDIAEREEQEHQRPRSGPVAFFKEVRAEGRKITWATRQETIVSTVMVVIMVILMALFFFAADSIIHALISLLLGIGQ